MSVLICHQCGRPIHESDAVCPHCDGVQPERPGHPPEPNVELVPVFRGGDAGLIALANSLLDAEGIEYMARNEALQDLFGWGRLAGGFNYIVGPVEFVVRKDDADRARTLLRGLADADLTDVESRET